MAALNLPNIDELSAQDLIYIINIGLSTSFTPDYDYVNVKRYNNSLRIDLIQEDVSVLIERNFNATILKGDGYVWDRSSVIAVITKLDYTIYTGDTVSVIYEDTVLEIDIQNLNSTTYSNINQTTKEKTQLTGIVTNNPNTTYILSGDTVTLSLDKIWDMYKT